jgi:hypothetical protein
MIGNRRSLQSALGRRYIGVAPDMSKFMKQKESRAFQCGVYSGHYGVRYPYGGFRVREYLRRAVKLRIALSLVCAEEACKHTKNSADLDSNLKPCTRLTYCHSPNPLPLWVDS